MVHLAKDLKILPAVPKPKWLRSIYWRSWWHQDLLKHSKIIQKKHPHAFRPQWVSPMSVKSGSQAASRGWPAIVRFL